MNERPKEISYYAHEAEMARIEAHSWRWMIAALIAFAALIITNFGWIVYETQYQDVVYTENTQDGGGVNVMGDNNTWDKNP